MTSTLQEMGALHLSRPAPHASAAEVADWYERKAALLEHLAAESAAQARSLAAAAHRHAARLLRHSGGVVAR